MKKNTCNFQSNCSASFLGNQMQDNWECQVIASNLAARVNEDLLWELFLQVGPVVAVDFHKSHAFIEFQVPQSVDYGKKFIYFIFFIYFSLHLFLRQKF